MLSRMHGQARARPKRACVATKVVEAGELGNDGHECCSLSVTPVSGNSRCGTFEWAGSLVYTYIFLFSFNF